MDPEPRAVKSGFHVWPRSAGGWSALALAGASLIAASRDPVGLSRFVLGFAYRGVIVDVARWQAWADANPAFFGALEPGARFAFVEHVKDSTGVVLTRTPRGMIVAKTHLLRFSDVPVVLAADPPIAAEIQTLDMKRDGDKFWDGFKNLARRRALRAYRYGSREEMERLGLARFLRGFDVFDPDDSPPRH